MPLDPPLRNTSDLMTAMPAERYTVRVTKDYLVFCSGHFITYDGDQCERLHGHNYRVAVEVEATLDANHYVFDFIALKQSDAGDHRRARPPHAAADRERPDPRRRAAGSDPASATANREWVFPREDCVAAADREHDGGTARHVTSASGSSMCCSASTGSSRRHAGRGRGELRADGDVAVEQ